jgi:hypothetical protein
MNIPAGPHPMAKLRHRFFQENQTNNCASKPSMWQAIYHLNTISTSAFQTTEQRTNGAFSNKS